MKKYHRRNVPRIRLLAESQSPVLRYLLDNGLAVVLCPRPHLSQAYLAFYCGVASRHERPENNGVTHVLEHMLFRGTRSFADATALNLAAEEFGGFLEGATYRDHVAFATAAHPDSVGEAVDILAELVQTPRYRAMEVERAILREELLETLDADGRMVDLDNITHRLVFGDLGLGLPIEGSLANIERFRVADLEAHRRQYMVGANCVLSIAGPMEPRAVLAKIRKAFRTFPSGSPPLVIEPSPPTRAPQVRYVRDAASQVDIRICFRGVPVHDREYPALVMLARILADGLGSRMHAELVDRRGLAYALHAGLTTYGDCGLFDFEVSVAPDRAAEVVKAILEFASTSSRFRFGDAELKRVRRRYRYGIEFMRDSPGDLASWYGRSTLFGVERHMDMLGHRIERLSETEIRHAARSVFQRQGLVMTAVGELARGEWKRATRVVDRWPGSG